MYVSEACRENMCAAKAPSALPFLGCCPVPWQTEGKRELGVGLRKKREALPAYPDVWGVLWQWWAAGPALGTVTLQL